MILFPNAKINIGLQILSKRPDNYHNMHSLLFPIPIFDILEIVKSDEPTTRIFVSGIEIADTNSDNLCVKAFNLIAKEASITPIDIHLHKRIPIGAGLAGGSSDAAYTLIAINSLFNLNYNDDKLHDLASRIGSDCAFFIKNKPALASERGDILTPYNIQINKTLIVIKPDIFISTPKAYSLITPNADVPDLASLLSNDLHQWKNSIVNDFEKPIFDEYPEIRHIKDTLYEHGAIYASMSGSGSAVFGIFDNIPNIIYDNPNYQTFICKI